MKPLTVAIETPVQLQLIPLKQITSSGHYNRVDIIPQALPSSWAQGMRTGVDEYPPPRNGRRLVREEIMSLISAAQCWPTDDLIGNGREKTASAVHMGERREGVARSPLCDSAHHVEPMNSSVQTKTECPRDLQFSADYHLYSFMDLYSNSVFCGASPQFGKRKRASSIINRPGWRMGWH